MIFKLNFPDRIALKWIITTNQEFQFSSSDKNVITKRIEALHLVKVRYWTTTIHLLCNGLVCRRGKKVYEPAITPSIWPALIVKVDFSIQKNLNTSQNEYMDSICDWQWSVSQRHKTGPLSNHRHCCTKYQSILPSVICTHTITKGVWFHKQCVSVIPSQISI